MNGAHNGLFRIYFGENRNEYIIFSFQGVPPPTPQVPKTENAFCKQFHRRISRGEIWAVQVPIQTHSPSTPPPCSSWARGWLAFSLAQGNEARRKTWMPVVNHPEAHLPCTGPHIPFTDSSLANGKNWCSDGCNIIYVTFPSQQILMRLWKSPCY